MTFFSIYTIIYIRHAFSGDGQTILTFCAVRSCRKLPNSFAFDGSDFSSTTLRPPDPL